MVPAYRDGPTAFEENRQQNSKQLLRNGNKKIHPRQRTRCTHIHRGCTHLRFIVDRRDSPVADSAQPQPAPT